MKKIFCLLLMLSSVSFARPVPIAQSISLVKKFKSFSEFFDFAETALPGRGYKSWAEWSEKIAFSEIRVEGQKVYVANLKEPFEIANDGRTVSYRGISVTLKAGISPKAAAKECERAWGQFQELRKIGKWILLVPNFAYADGRQKSLDQAMTGAVIVLAGEAVAGLAIGAAASAVGMAYLLYASARYIYFNHDLKGNAVVDAKLECKNGVAHFIDASAKTSMPLQWKPEEGLDPEEVKIAQQTLAEICKNPEAVEKFNLSLFFLKKKIFSGEAKFFSRPTPKMNLLDPNPGGAGVL